MKRKKNDSVMPVMLNGKEFWPDYETAKRHQIEENGHRVRRWMGTPTQYMEERF